MPAVARELVDRELQVREPVAEVGAEPRYRAVVGSATARCARRRGRPRAHRRMELAHLDDDAVHARVGCGTPRRCASRAARAAGRLVRRHRARPPRTPRRSRRCRRGRRSRPACARSTSSSRSTSNGCGRVCSSASTPCTPSSRRPAIRMRSIAMHGSAAVASAARASASRSSSRVTAMISRPTDPSCGSVSFSMTAIACGAAGRRGRRRAGSRRSRRAGGRRTPRGARTASRSGSSRQLADRRVDDARGADQLVVRTERHVHVRDARPLRTRAGCAASRAARRRA